MQTIWEHEFLPNSYGYRPKKSAHQAVHSLALNLHYVLDLWFEKQVKPSMEGRCMLVRYADDCVPRRRKRGHSPLQLCCIRDESRPLEAAMQVEASNHRKLRQ